MSDPMVAFFSYSRRDSDFALKLAKDLRQHGAAVWLDQLDINPGEHWDTAVEQAVANCPKMLLILSPDSVESTNVMDEVSFALEQQKVVVPVLHRDCKIPFRLRRVQYVDARTDYERGLQELLLVLRAPEGHEDPSAKGKPMSSAAVAGAGVEQTVDKPDQARIEREQSRAAHIPRETEEFEAGAARDKVREKVVERESLAGSKKEPKTQNSSRKLLIGGLGVGVVLVLGIVVSLTMMRKGEQPTVPPVQVAKVPDGSQPVQRKAPERGGPSGLKPNTEWLTQFVRVSEGPDVDALRPYFADLVSPFYSLPSADWAAISDNRRTYFSKFPTIHYSMVGEPEIKPISSGRVLSFDLAYDRVRSDGHKSAGTAHVTMTAVLVGRAWKIAGIQQQKEKEQ